MAPVIEETEVSPHAALHDRIVDAGRKAAHLSHEAQLIKSMAEDDVEDGIHAARRATKTVARQLYDLRDDAAYRVKRQPFAAVGIAAGAGLLIGLASGWMAGRLVRTTKPTEG